jgi:hypothetical protein
MPIAEYLDTLRDQCRLVGAQASGEAPTKSHEP